MHLSLLFKFAQKHCWTDTRTERFVVHRLRRSQVLFVFRQFRARCGRVRQRDRIRVECGHPTADRVRISDLRATV